MSKVVVAMSGGVDSSVAALLVRQQGYEALGVSMQVWDYRNHGGCNSKATCCAPDDFTDARKVAAIVGIPYYVFDFEKTFRKEVIDKFVDSYLRGITPNPCVDCNNKVKFKELRERAASFGCDFVATGHYARIEKREDGFHLLRGADLDKDQSYFLYNLTQHELRSTLFPVGHLSKPEVRELAKNAGLPTAVKPESQDICFVSGSAGDFVARIGGARRSGNIVDMRGNKLGAHEGIEQFTVGQRRGLGLGGTEEPLYVVAIESETNTVRVGAKEDLRSEGFLVQEISWALPQALTQRTKVMVQVRSRHRGIEAEMIPQESGEVRVQFTDSWVPVSPGQAAVFYDLKNEEVLGGGRIAAARRPAQMLEVREEVRYGV